MNNTIDPATFPTSQLKEWFLENQRQLPWRLNPTPYSVWISEIMLQQTQAQVVVKYFETWMKEFPDIQALANASIEKVLKIWEGLGYYSRARFIHQAAIEIMEKHQGRFPDTKEELAKIKGIGPYTQGAILSFAYHQKAAAVDGNVLRVLARYFSLSDPIDLPKTKKQLENLAFSILPDSDPWLVMEGLIELGALVCKKKAVCSECPLRKNCKAHKDSIQNLLPVKKSRVKITTLERTIAVILYKGSVLLQRGEKGRIMADLYEFPYLDEKVRKEDILESFGRKTGLKLAYVRALPQENQSFTRFRLTLYPHLLRAKEQEGCYLWKGIEEARSLPFSSGHRRILTNLLNER